MWNKRVRDEKRTEKTQSKSKIWLIEILERPEKTKERLLSKE